jgi:GDP-4-dehydro-6-deoxy-D-mannose reductase
MRALVTGAGGFVGPHLLAHLRDAGDDVVGADLEVDVTDPSGVRANLAHSRPQVVYHLAALSHVGTSWTAPAEVFRVNTEGTLNVLLASIDAGVERVVVIGSAEQYGVVASSRMPISEDEPMLPVTPYGASKAAAEMAASHAWRGRGLPVICVRAFNHLGPGQPDALVASSIAKQIAANEHDGGELVHTGDLSATRDFTDVRDVVRAYRLLATRGEPGAAYNVCSGESVAIESLAGMLLDMAKHPMRLELDPSRLRPVEVPVHWGSNARLRAATGWEPTIPLAQSLLDLLEGWRAAV